jgi:hypothetical protein
LNELQNIGKHRELVLEVLAVLCDVEIRKFFTFELKAVLDAFPGK